MNNRSGLLRTGRKQPKNLYLTAGTLHSDDDQLVGQCQTEEIAQGIVKSWNKCIVDAEVDAGTNPTTSPD